MDEYKLRDLKFDGTNNTERLWYRNNGGSKAMTTWGLSLRIP